MSVIGSNILAGASGQGGGYNLTNSLRFRSSASAYLNRTPAGSPTSTQKFTQSYWVKRGTLSTTQYIYNCEPSDWVRAYIFSDNIFYFDIRASGTNYSVGTTQVFRDPSAWYHIVISVDTTQATAANRVIIYVNGVQAPTNTPTIPQNSVTVANSANPNFISAYKTPNQYFDGYLAEVNFIDGQALTPSSFGETSTTTGVWIPKKYTGTYGTNGFYLPFTNTASTSTLGNDFSGNGNTWTTNNFSLTAGTTYDSMTDVPTLTSATAANYAVLNAAIPKTYVSTADGNLKSVGTSSTDSDTAVATIGVSSGKWYWEDRIGAISSSVYPILGAGRNILSSFVGKYPGDSSVGGFGIVVGNGNIVREGSIVTTVTALVANDVVGFALDLGALTCAIYKNNSLIYTVTSLTAGTYYPMVNEYSSSNSTHNYGQQPFAYTPPSGFVRLNTFNLTTPTIGATASTTANKYFDASLWTGNGASSQVVTNSGSMQPDFVWIKSRNQAFGHLLFDSVRGISLYLQSNGTGAEVTDVNMVSSFNSNGFTVGSSGFTNGNTYTQVGWQWRASNATAVTNTAGSITSTVSANTTAGFSIVTYTGTGSNATVGHGLGVAPSMIIARGRSAGTDGFNWRVYHGSLAATAYLEINTTSAQQTDATVWNSTAPTSSVFSLGTSGNVNGSTQTYVAYCFAPIAGYSAFGSYTGNGSSDGTFIYTGFRPAFVITKSSSAVSNWELEDYQRGYNGNISPLIPNDSLAEFSGDYVDLLSNGFKIRTSSTAWNSSGITYIYMAFAEVPQKFALGR